MQTRILNNALAVYCLLNQMTQMDKVCDTYSEYICIYGRERLGSYCFSSNSDVGLVENVVENIQGKIFAKFRMLQIEEGKHVYHIYTFVTLTFRTEVILSCRLWIK